MKMAIPADAEELPEVTDELLDGVTLAYDRSETRAQMAIDDASMLRRAAQTVWYHHCRRHPCEGPPCTHPNHRRDVDYLTDRLEMLGIKSAPGEGLGSGATCSSSICLPDVDS